MKNQTTDKPIEVNISPKPSVKKAPRRKKQVIIPGTDTKETDHDESLFGDMLVELSDDNFKSIIKDQEKLIENLRAQRKAVMQKLKSTDDGCQLIENRLKQAQKKEHRIKIKIKELSSALKKIKTQQESLNGDRQELKDDLDRQKSILRELKELHGKK